jgi:hypothetical protein
MVKYLASFMLAHRLVDHAILSKMLHATTASAEPKIGLVGYTGFVGSTILKTLKCSHLYNSKNIETLKNEEFDRLIFTASIK